MTRTNYTLSMQLLIACDQSYYTESATAMVGRPLAPLPDRAVDAPDEYRNPDVYQNQPRFPVASGYEVFEGIDKRFVIGGQGLVYLDPNTREVIVAFGGTDGIDGQDWRTNTADQGWGQWVKMKPDVDAVLALIGDDDRVKAKGGIQKIHFTGQSLGGAIAQYAAYDYAQKKPEDRIPLSKVTLTTFNGLGAIWALKQNGGYDPGVLTGLGEAAHYVVDNDLVSRLGGGHIGTSGEVQFLNWKYLALRPGKPMGVIDAHRIETAFYTHLYSSYGFTDASARSEASTLIEIPNAVTWTGITGNLFNNENTTPREAWARLVAGLIGTGVAADVSDINQVLQAIREANHRSGWLSDSTNAVADLSLWGYAVKVFAHLPASRAAYFGMLGAAIGSEIAEEHLPAFNQKIGGYFKQLNPQLTVPTLTYKDVISAPSRLKMLLPASPEAWTNPAWQNRARRNKELLGGTDITPALAEAIANGGEHFALAAAQVLANALLESPAVQALSPAERAIVLADAVNFEFLLAADGAGTDTALSTQQVADTLAFWSSDVGNAISHLNPEFMNAGDSTLKLASLSTFTEKKDFIEATLVGLQETDDAVVAFAPSAAASDTRQQFETIASEIRRDSEIVVIKAGHPDNPFDADGYDPAAETAASGEFASGEINTFTVFLPFAAAEGGQHIKLRLDADNPDSISLVKGSEVLLQDTEGQYEIVIPEKQRQFTFSVATLKPIDTAGSLSLAATLVDAQEEPTHVTQVELTASLAPTAAPTFDRTILGDLDPADLDPVTDGVQTGVDELGNVITDPNKPDPDRVDFLNDSASNDDIRSGGSADWVTVFRGGDDRVDLGNGNDFLFSYDPGDHDTGIGGEGKDVLIGDEGTDALYTGSEVSLDDALARQDAAASGTRELLDGYFGDDTLIGDTGNDALLGGGGNDLIIGGAGDDDINGDLYVTDLVLFQWDVQRSLLNDGKTYHTQYVQMTIGLPAVGGGDDVIYAGGGVDWVSAYQGNDWVDAGAGDDIVFGHAGNDDLFGGSGADRLWGDTGTDQGGDDYLDGEAGDDRLYGNGGHDQLFGGDDTDWLQGDDNTGIDDGGDDYLDGEAGADTLYGMSGNDTLFGGSGADLMVGDNGSGVGSGDDYLDGEAGDDQLYGNAGNDALYGGDGDDWLQGDNAGGVGSDVLDGEAGNDTLLGMGGADTLFGGADADKLFGDAGDDLLSGGGGADSLNGGDGNDTLDGGSEVDNLFGQAGNDTVSGGDGADWLQGDNGDGIGDGDDSVDGGDGNDVLFGEGGHDTLNGGADNDQLQGGDGNDHLAGGSAADVLYGDTGDDILLGGDGDDMLLGGDGNDTLDGGAGNDVYFVSGGEGIDRIVDSGGTDWLVLTDALWGQVVLGVGSLKVTLPSGGELHLDDFDPDRPLDGAIEYFQFADNTVMTRQQLIQTLGFRIDGTPEDDLLSGTAFADPINALTGNDHVDGRGGNDSIDLGDGNDVADAGGGDDTVRAGNGNDTALGGAGADRLFGDGGDDVLAGGAGNDTVDGGSGNDTFRFGPGDGQDVVTDMAGDNTIRLEGALTPEQIVLRRLGDDLVISLVGGNEQISVRGWFSASGSGWTLQFDDDRRLDRAAVSERLQLNQAPVLAEDALTVAEDGLLQAGGNALANDADPEGRVLRITTPGEMSGRYGNLSLAANGSFSYRLDNTRPAVQGLAAGEQATDRFAYTATDDDPAGAATASSAIVVNIAGANDAPAVSDDFGQVVEDGVQIATGNVLANDRDIDTGAVLRVATPGSTTTAYGTLTLAADGAYAYTLANAAPAVQALGRSQAVTERLAYAADDGQVRSAATLVITVAGTNDAPTVAAPLADQNASPNKAWTWTLPAGSFSDTDQGDALDLGARLADGSALPSWLVFDAATQTFSGRVPRTATGFVDIEVTATDRVAATGSTQGSLSARDVFRLDFGSGSGGSGGGGGGESGGGGSQGNEGVGNGIDAPPPGHDASFNDGPGTSPGDPGAKGGHRPPARHTAVRADPDLAMPAMLAGDAPAEASADAQVTASARHDQTGTTSGDTGHGRPPLGAGPQTLDNAPATMSAVAAGADSGWTIGALNLAPPDLTAYLDAINGWNAPGHFSTAAETDDARVFADWLAVDLALAESNAADRTRSWFEAARAADTAALASLRSADPGARARFGDDALPLLAGSGRLKPFTGFGQGTQKII